MDIEEERKAFESVVLPTGLFKAVEWNGERYTMDGGRCMTQDYFEVWIKAKQHTEEMRKPEVRISVGNGGYELWDNFDERLGVGDTREDCIVWAQDSGYWVIE